MNKSVGGLFYLFSLWVFFYSFLGAAEGAESSARIRIEGVRKEGEKKSTRPQKEVHSRRLYALLLREMRPKGLVHGDYVSILLRFHIKIF